MDWNRLLDRLKTQLGCNETELGEVLGISRSMLSQCRSGTRPLPATVKIKLLDKLAYRLTRQKILSVLPDEFAAAVQAADDSTFLSRASRLAVLRFIEEFENQPSLVKELFVENLCALNSCSREVLSKTLGLEDEQLQQVIDGKEKLPFWAKQSILDNFDLVELSTAVDQFSA